MLPGLRAPLHMPAFPARKLLPAFPHGDTDLAWTLLCTLCARSRFYLHLRVGLEEAVELHSEAITPQVCTHPRRLHGRLSPALWRACLHVYVHARVFARMHAKYACRVHRLQNPGMPARLSSLCVPCR